MAPSYSDAVLELKAAFLKELTAGFAPAKTHLEVLEKEPANREAFKGLLDFFHKIAGTAASVDLTVLGHLAAVCEDVLRAAFDKNSVPTQMALNISKEGISGVEHVLEAANPLTIPVTKAFNESVLVVEERSTSKVLIIDDDPFSARLIDSCLKSAGFLSSFCCNPNEAIAHVQTEMPDLIILDVQMPGVDGFDMCRRIRAHPGHQLTPIIFVTRRGDVTQRVRGLEVGGNDYISKPFEPQELIARVRSHLQLSAELRNVAVRDGLTRCFNHKYFKVRLEQEIARAVRYNEIFTVGMLDADFFKRINDNYGHPAGDEVLVHLANLVSSSVRGTDVVARYGGEEFGILFVQATAQEASVITSRIRERVENHKFAIKPNGSTEILHIPVTVSIGVTQFSAQDTLQSLLQRADAALYQAKHEGRNQVRVLAA